MPNQEPKVRFLYSAGSRMINLSNMENKASLAAIKERGLNYSNKCPLFPNNNHKLLVLNKLQASITDIIPFKKTEDNLTKDKIVFFLRVFAHTIEACLEMKYSAFDALTTSNCCHGMALYSRDLLISVLKLDLVQILAESNELLQFIENNTTNDVNLASYKWFVPLSLVNLTRLYILGFIRQKDSNKGDRTNKYKLKEISPISTRFCDQLVDSLQKYYSNLIAQRYESCLAKIDRSLVINNHCIADWGKYISSSYLRKDSRDIIYASCLFSMQVSLAYLIASKAVVVVINDIYDENHSLMERTFGFLRGNALDRLMPMSNEELMLVSPYEPVIIFSGCSMSKWRNINAHKISMKTWLSKFPELVLACDTKYPQFPKIKNDQYFDWTPISPIEENLTKTIEEQAKIAGTSLTNPSLFCLTHIYTASMGQTIASQISLNDNSLPLAYLPINKIPEQITNSNLASNF